MGTGKATRAVPKRGGRGRRGAPAGVLKLGWRQAGAGARAGPRAARRHWGAARAGLTGSRAHARRAQAAPSRIVEGGGRAAAQLAAKQAGLGAGDDVGDAAAHGAQHALDLRGDLAGGGWAGWVCGWCGVVVFLVMRSSAGCEAGGAGRCRPHQPHPHPHHPLLHPPHPPTHLRHQGVHVGRLLAVKHKQHLLHRLAKGLDHLALLGHKAAAGWRWGEVEVGG